MGKVLKMAHFGRIFLYFLLVLGGKGVIFAQDYVFQRYEPKDGYSPTTVEDIIRCDDGYIWMATWSGVFRFDGHEFTRFTSGLLPYNERFDRIEYDESRSLLYAIRHDGRLMVISKDSQKIRDSGFPQNIAGMYRLRNGETVFAGENGCIYITEDGDEEMPVMLSVYYDAGTHRPATDVFSDNNGRRYILYDSGIVRDREFISTMPGLCHLQSGSTLYIGSTDGRILVVNERGESEIRHTGIPGDITMLSTIPTEYTLLAATETGELYKFAPESGSVRLPAPYVGSRGFRCAKGNDGQLWLYSKNGSLSRYSPADGSFVPFLDSSGKEWGPENNLSAFYCDAQNILWIAGNARSFEKAYRRDNPFEIIDIGNRGGAPSLESSVRSLFRSPDGLIYIGTRDGRIHIYDDAIENRIARWRAMGTVQSIACDKEGRIWLGTDGNGVAENNVRRGDFPAFRPQYYHTEPGYYDSNSDYIHSLCVAPDGRTWVGSYDAGLSFTYPSDREQRFISKKNLLAYPTGSFERVRHICFSPDSSILYAACTDGLLVCDNPYAEPEEIRFKSIESMKGIDFQHLMFSSAGELFASSYGNGLLRLDPDAIGAVHESYTMEDGLLSNYVLSSTEDADGYIWIVTDVGLCRLNPDNETLVNFPSDRIHGDIIFNEGPPIVCADGRICIGTNSGVLRFDPSEVSNSTYSPRLLLSSVMVNGSPGSLSGAWLQRLKPKDRIILTLKAIDMRAPERVAYYYRLLPHKSQGNGWTSLGTNDRLTLEDLRPGQYTLSLRSTNSEGFPADNEMEFSFRVRRSPAWMILFISIAAAGLSTCAILLYRRRKIAGSGRGDADFARRLDKFLGDNIDNSELELKDVCLHLGMSRNTVYAKCRECFDATPAMRLAELRLNKAAALLRDSDQSISQIAYACGFNDPHYFSKSFRRRFGSSPRDFRRAYKDG